MQTYIVKVYETHTVWYNEEGEVHRTDGPAVEYAVGSKYWYINGKLHRTDGPAIEWANGNKQWWIDGEKLTQSEFEARKKPCVGKKVIVDGVEYILS